MKNTVIKIIEKRRDEFDKIYPFINKVNNLIERTEQVKSHTNTTLLEIAKAEVARLRGEQKKIKHEHDRDDTSYEIGHSMGYEKALQDQITHWQEVVNILEK